MIALISPVYKRFAYTGRNGLTEELLRYDDTNEIYRFLIKFSHLDVQGKTMTEARAIDHSVHHPRQLKDSFLKVNRMRLARTHEYLGTDQSHFLELIPLLFHINHPDLPGFAGENAAAGVSQYSPGYGVTKALKTLFPW